MQYPKRFDTHITETASFKIFNNAVPNEWVIREVTERDYGIDCYVEISEEGFMTGKLISIQLKASENEIPVRENGTVVTYYGIEASSLNYWNSLPVPVILAYVDVPNSIVYFSDIKESIRSNYSEFQKEKYKNIKINSENKLTQQNCINEILNIYNKEIHRQELELILSSFLVSLNSNFEFLTQHDHLDCFLPLDDGGNENSFIFRNIYNQTKYLADFFSIAWNVESIEEINQKGKKMFNPDDRYGYDLYEGPVADSIKKIMPIFRKIILQSKYLITEKEKNYWYEKNRDLFEYSDSKNSSEIIDCIDKYYK